MPTPSNSTSTERAIMNGKAWTANPLLVGTLLLVLGAGCASVHPVEKNGPCVPKPLPPNSRDHKMSDEATMLPDPADPKSFKADPCITDPYDSKAELDIYGDKKMIDRP